MTSKPNLPSTMTAVIQPSKTSHALAMAEVPVPVPTHPEDVLVKVHATSPCAGELDWALWAPEFIGPDKKPIPGQDLAGTVVWAPTDYKFKPGDGVYARINANRPGAAAEYTLARVSELAPKPEALDWIHAAATPISALTAYQALFVQGTLEVAALHGNETARATNARLRVLITAASGGVGSWAVQLARAAGAGGIVAVCGPRNAGFARELGATDVVDYTRQSLAEWAAQAPDERACHLVVDCIGGKTLGHCWSAVREGGTLISVCSVPEQSRPEGVTKKLKKSLWFVVESLGRDLDVITRLIKAGTCRPVVDSVVGFGSFAEAWAKVEAGHARGKVVVIIDGQT